MTREPIVPPRRRKQRRRSQVHLGIGLPEEDRELIREAAAAWGRSMSAYAREELVLSACGTLEIDPLAWRHDRTRAPSPSRTWLAVGLPRTLADALERRAAREGTVPQLLVEELLRAAIEV